MALPYVVVDACVAGAWSFAEVYSVEAQTVLTAMMNRRVIAISPDRFVEEILRLCQKKTLPLPVGASILPNDAWDRFMDVVTSPIVFLPSEELHEQAWRLTLTTGLTTHDALYLALSLAWGAELWTLDAKLASVAGPLFPAIHDLRISPFPY